MNLRNQQPKRRQAGFVRLGGGLWHWVARRCQLRSLRRRVLEQSRQMFPGETPAWSMLAEERGREWIFYVTYSSSKSPVPVWHRFFAVRRDDLTVEPLEDSYAPAQWGPFY